MSSIKDRRLTLHEAKMQRTLGVSSCLEDRLRRGTLDVEDLKYLCKNHPDVEIRQHIRSYRYPFAVFMGRHGIGFHWRQKYPNFAHNANSRVSAADLTAYTLAVSLGTENPSRVAVTISASGNVLGAPVLDISSVTVNSVAASEVVKRQQAANQDGVIAIHTARVPTGGSVNAVVTFNEATLRCGLGLWSVYNLNDEFASHVSNGSVGTGTALNADLNVKDRMVVFAGNACRQTAANRTTVWTGVTEDYDGVIESLQWTHSGGSFTATADETPRTITSTLNAATLNHMLVSAAFY